jgi:predicted porin
MLTQKNFAPKMLVVALSLAVPTLVQAEAVSVYGKINLTAQQADEGKGSFSELKSNASRFGVKGDYALDGGLSLIYQLEWEVDPSDDADKNIKSRDQFLGLAGAFGTLKVGRNDSAMKLSQGKTDLFNDYEADIKALWKGENRLNNSVVYQTPQYQGFSVLVSHVMEESPDGVDGQSVALLYGDESLKKSAWFASLAMDNDINGYDNRRATAQTKVAGAKVALGIQQQEEIKTAQKADGWYSSLAYPLGSYELKAQFQTLEDDQGLSLGADYKLGDNTKVFAWYSSFDFETKVDSDYLAIGVEHRF